MATPYIEQYERFLVAEQGATGNLVGMYAQTRAELAAFLANPPVPLSASDQAFYGALANEVDRLSREATSAASTWAAQSIPTAFVEGAKQHSASIVFTTVHDNAVRSLSGYSLGLITQMDEGMRSVVRQQIGVGLLEGASREVVSQRLVASGLMNIPHWRSVEERAEVIARTEIMRAYNSGNLFGILDSGAVAVRWITGHDERACPICAPRHGKVFRLPRSLLGGSDEELDPSVHQLPSLDPPPAHPRCRCTVRAWYGPDDEPVAPQPPPGGIIEQTPTPKGDPIPDAGAIFRQKASDLRLQFPTDSTYWHDLDIDDDMLRHLVDERLSDRDALTHFLQSRYGVQNVTFDASEFEAYWTAYPGVRWNIMHGLERYRAGFLRNVDSSSYFKSLHFGTPRDMSSNALADCGITGQIRLSLRRLLQYEGNGKLRGGPDVNGVEEIMVHELGHALHNRFGMLYAQGRGYMGTWGTRAAELGGGYSSENPAIEALWKTYASIRRKTKGIAGQTDLKSIESRISDLQVRVKAYEEALADGFESLPLSGTTGRIWDVNTHTMIDVPLREVRYYVTTPGGFTTVKETFNSAQSIEWARGQQQLAIDSLSKTVKKLQKGGDMYPTEYAKTNMREDFAESSMLYLLNPERLREVSPARFAFMRDEIFAHGGPQ